MSDIEINDLKMNDFIKMDVERNLNDERIILEVKKRPALYDTNHKLYKNNSHRNKIWREVASDLGLSARLCMTRWKRLRDKYQRVRKFQANGDGASFFKGSSLIMSLDFLEPIIETTNPVKRRKLERKAPVKSKEVSSFQDLKTTATTLKFVKISPAPAPKTPVHNYEGSDHYDDYDLSIEDEHIILEVKKRPVLYDSHNELYRNKVARKKLWGEIAWTLDLPVALCTKRWKALREKYKKCQQQIMWSGIDATDLETRPLMMALNFIDDKSNSESRLAQLKYDESSLQDLQPPSTYKLDKIVAAVNNSVQTIDGLHHYGLSIASDLRNMEPSEQRRAKLEISLLLAKCEYKN